VSVTLRIYYDFASPFCYVARGVVTRLRRQHALHVEWLPFEVIDYLPARGAMPQNPAFVRRAEARYATRVAAEYGLPLHLRDRLLNSNLALCAVEYARAKESAEQQPGLTDAVHAALFTAYYQDGRDISDAEEVVAVCLATGTGPGVAAALQDGRYRTAVAHSREQAHALGVVAVPTFVAGDHAVVGIPSFDAFEALMKQAQQHPG
jgi:predicted DsbA family dithiol-disulfide isomerase